MKEEYEDLDGYEWVEISNENENHPNKRYGKS